jgi:DNA-binding NarL/FixJ family response regulator
MDEITLLLVADDALLRGLRMRLELEPTVLIVGEAPGFDDGRRLADSLAPDVVVLDADLSARREVALEVVRSLSPAHSVVVISLRDHRRAAAEALAAGAVAFVRKHEAGRFLMAAVREAASDAERRKGAR